MKTFLATLRGNELLLTLCGTVAFVMLGLSMISPILPLYGRSFGISGVLIGLIVSAYPIARLFTNTPAGRLADRYGRRPLLFAGLGIIAVASVINGLAVSYPMLLTGRFVEGIGSATYLAAAQATIADISTPANRGRMMSTFQGSFLLGATVGPSVGGLIAAMAGARGVFFVYSGLALCGIAFAFWRRHTLPVIPPVPVGATAPDARKPSPFAAWRFLADRSFLAVCLVIFAQFFTRAGTRTTALPLLGADRYGLSEERIGAILTLAALGNLVCVPLAGWLVDTVGRKAAIVPSTLLAGFSVLLFIWSPSVVWFAVAALAFGLSTGISGPAPSAYVADLAAGEGIGARLGVSRSFGDLGFILGPICVGFISDVFDYNEALLVNAAMFLVAGGYFALVARETGGRGLKPAGRAAATPATPTTPEATPGDD